ncbi:MAG TPA: hypothetical protein VH593_07665 [Ktedonobacteraceae bacterium]
MKFTVLKVWLPETTAGVDPEMVTLHSAWSLQFFLECLYHGHTLYGVRPFELCAYQGDQFVSRAFLRVQYAEFPHLVIVSAPPELYTMLREAWTQMLARVRKGANA